MKRIAIVLASALIAVLPVSAAHAQTPSAPKNAGVTGMWLGTNSGFENGVYKSSEVR